MTDFSTIQSEHAGTNKMCDQIPKIILCIAIVAIVCVFTLDIMYVYQKHKLDLQQQKDEIELVTTKKIENIEKEIFYQQITHQEMITKIYEKIKEEMIEQQITNQKTFTKMFSRMDYIVDDISYLKQ